VLADLDISVSGLGASGGDSEREQGFVVFNKIETGEYALLEVGFAGDYMVGGRDYYRGLGVAGGDMPCSPCHTRGCIAAGWLEKDLFAG